MTYSALGRRYAACLGFASLLTLGSAFAQQDQTQEKAGEKADSEKTTRAFRGRLPNYWTQLGLSEEQREKIYAAQRKAREKSSSLEEQLEKLQQQVRELRDEIGTIRDDLRTELHGYLTPEQAEKLVKVQEEAAKARLERRAARAKQRAKAKAKPKAPSDGEADSETGSEDDSESSSEDSDSDDEA